MSKVSVIIPAYNAEKYITYAIKTVINQTHPDIEIIVIDDGSTDDTAEVLKPYMDRIIYHYQNNQGVTYTRNTGIDLATGEYIAFLDHDDYYLDANKTAEQVLLLESHPDWDGIHAGWQIVSEAGEYKSQIKPWEQMPEFTTKAWFKYSPVFLQTMLFRRTCFDTIRFSTHQTSEDTFLIAQLLLAGYQIGWHRKVTTAYRFVPISKTNKNPYDHLKNSLSVWKKILELPELPKNIDPKSILYSKLLWMVFTLIKQGATDQLSEFLDEMAFNTPYHKDKTYYDAIAQLTKLLYIHEQQSHQLPEMFSAYIPQPDLLNWWHKVWWWYHINYHTMDNSLEDYHSHIVQSLADFSRQEHITLSQKSLHIMIWIGLGYGEGWSTITMIRRFAKDAKINPIWLYSAILYMSIRYRNWWILR